jgi:hypothetical protein
MAFSLESPYRKNGISAEQARFAHKKDEDLERGKILSREREVAH